MTVAEMMGKKLVLSFEVYPPKMAVSMAKLCINGGVLDQMYELAPDYISCTYSKGSVVEYNHMAILNKIRTDGRTIPIAHFTCVGSTRQQIRAQMQQYLACGIDHVLAIRGDLPDGWTDTGGDLQYATDLLAFIRKDFGRQFTLCAAGSPEGHISCESFEKDVAYLKQKQDEGAEFIMTQLCWDMDQFRRWMEAIRAAGVWLPVDVGVMPVLDIPTTINMALARNGCVMPQELCRMISNHWIFPNPYTPNEKAPRIAEKQAAFREEGMAYTIGQIAEYQKEGIQGIHMYTLNKVDDIAQIVRAAGLR